MPFHVPHHTNKRTHRRRAMRQSDLAMHSRKASKQSREQKQKQTKRKSPKDGSLRFVPQWSRSVSCSDEMWDETFIRLQETGFFWHGSHPRLRAVLGWVGVRREGEKGGGGRERGRGVYGFDVVELGVCAEDGGGVRWLEDDVSQAARQAGRQSVSQPLRGCSPFVSGKAVCMSSWRENSQRVDEMRVSPSLYSSISWTLKLAYSTYIERLVAFSHIKGVTIQPWSLLSWHRQNYFVMVMASYTLLTSLALDSWLCVCALCCQQWTTLSSMVVYALSSNPVSDSSWGIEDPVSNFWST